MLIVENDSDAVEADLQAGILRCVSCSVGVLRRWGYARRRVLRDGQGFRPRRAMCAHCSGTHVLLPEVCLLRRRDSAAAMGAALGAVVTNGERVEDVAMLHGVPLETLRGWIARLRKRAGVIISRFGRWLIALGPGRALPEPSASPMADALGAIGAVARAACVAICARPPWSWASRLSAGLLFSNTSSPWPSPD